MSKSTKQTRVNIPRTGAGAAFTAACKGKLPRIRLDAAWLARFKRRFAEAHIAARLANDEIRAAGFIWPDDELTTEDWEFLARVVEEREPGNLTAREIHQIALAWVERERMRKRIVLDVEPEVDETDELDALVTLDQASALIGLAKRTLERYATNGKLPTPDIQGGGGRAHRWFWRSLKPALEIVGNRKLPDRFPSSRIL